MSTTGSTTIGDSAQHRTNTDPNPGGPSASGGSTGGEYPPELTPGSSTFRALLLTTGICAGAGASGHLVLLTSWVINNWGDSDRGLPIPWQPVVGFALVLVSVVAFGGFYRVSYRARVAMTASFVLTFLVLLSFALTLSELGDLGQDQPQLSDALVEDFRTIVLTIVGFYFGSETIVSVAKIVRTPPGDPTAIRRADRDIAAG